MLSYFEFLQTYGPRFISGTIVTLEQTLLGTVLAVGVALVMAFMKMSSFFPVRWIGITYIEIFRGTSLLVQMYWIFFVLPLFGITMDKFTAGFLAVGLNLGAYGAELVRGGIQSVPRGQYEAAIALNMPPFMRMRRIIFPQALLNMLPPWGNLLIELLKSTALVALISVTDLMFESKQINATTFLSAQAFGTALIIYYIIARGMVTPGMRMLEKKLSQKLSRE
ncbi:MAG: ectoine/hydroxyectoine ABC transporter permease subunit EhuC [Desulfotignum sp.]|nr:ectoine/hydroxyectoine ABC transporter permease subunit EhuC [Desulfotignum sp.]MCF8124950.1 ectoine/hydroxyectoine ABC transporter permease subunit EhuC [Desulfotignum sp.]